jgi:hypothetical protein
VIVPEGMVRDWRQTQAGIAVNFDFDLVSEGGAMGLDLYIRNRGAAALTVGLDGQGAITVDPGDVYIVNDSKYWLINIVSAVLYDLQIFGIRVTTLQKRGLM